MVGYEADLGVDCKQGRLLADNVELYVKRLTACAACCGHFGDVCGQLAWC
jgi:hypothetical protein